MTFLFSELQPTIHYKYLVFEKISTTLKSTRLAIKKIFLEQKYLRLVCPSALLNMVSLATVVLGAAVHYGLLHFGDAKCVIPQHGNSKGVAISRAILIFSCIFN